MDQFQNQYMETWLNEDTLANYITYQVTQLKNMCIVVSFSYNLITYSTNKLRMLFKQTAIVAPILALKSAKH